MPISGPFSSKQLVEPSCAITGLGEQFVSCVCSSWGCIRDANVLNFCIIGTVFVLYLCCICIAAAAAVLDGKIAKRAHSIGVDWPRPKTPDGN